MPANGSHESNGEMGSGERGAGGISYKFQAFKSICIPLITHAATLFESALKIIATFVAHVAHGDAGEAQQRQYPRNEEGGVEMVWYQCRQSVAGYYSNSDVLEC